ncbi:hypothetical protein [Bradyrhizobium sp. Ai1a-2]|uniref:hypothetical protein n=1 Tax=Bradyrhizobium sp. Ai1a-2 TaxID=196490 RepID=UPI00041653B6|nr:hypothetical protein [Bradyrhizobium sp. Ai1a-2]
MKKGETRPKHEAELIRDISEKVYREQLGEDDTRRMIEKDGDGGNKLRARAMQYDQLTRTYLKVLQIAPG